MKHIRTFWFNGAIGIVKGRDDVTNELKWYIGVGYGVDKDFDEHKVITRGSPITKETLMELLKDE